VCDLSKGFRFDLLTPYAFNSGLQAIIALPLFPHTLQLAVTQALGFSVITSCILAKDLYQCQCYFKSHTKSSFHNLILLPLFCSCQFRRLYSIQFLFAQAYIPADWCLETRLGSSESEPYVTTDGQSASPSWYKVPIRGLRPDFFFRSEYGIRLTVTFLIPWGALSDERTGMSFVCAAGPCQRSLSRS
jgi:hypothetical protein